MDAALLDKASLEGLSVNTLQRFMRSCLDIICCPVCLETVSRKAVQCVNDHLLCRSCRLKISECPTCRQPFSETKPSRFILQLIEALPKVCKYKGCGRLLEPEDNHELYCSFREIACKGCQKWTGCSSSLLEHVNLGCGISYYLDSTYGSIDVNGFDPLQKYNTFTLFVFDKYFFWEEIVNNPADKKFNITYHFEPNGKPEESIYLELMFISTKSRYTCNMKLNLDPEQSIEYNTFHVPWHTLPDYITVDKGLTYSYTFTKDTMGVSGISFGESLEWNTPAVQFSEVVKGLHHK